MINNTVVRPKRFARPRGGVAARERAPARQRDDAYHCFLSAFEQAPLAIAIADVDGRLQHANCRYLARTGRPLDTLVAENHDPLREGHPDDNAYQNCREALRRDGVWEGRLPFTTPKGPGCERVRIWPARDEQGAITHYICTRMDITALSQLEEERRQASKVETLGALAGGIAHDFNNVLAAINGYSELFQQTSDPFRQHRYVQQIRRAGERATLLVRRLLSFSRKNPPAVDAVDVNALIQELVAMMTETFPQLIEFETTLAASLPVLTADPAQMQQLLLNLCVNARDAMPTGGTITISTEVKAGSLLEHIGAEPALTYACLSVADTGVGMSAELRQRIFEPFFTTKYDRGGTGLGLSVVYNIVSGLHGLIDVRSTPGAGSSFHVYLPTGPSGALVPAAGIDDTFPGGTESILVADDEPALRELLTVALKAKGYSVCCVASGLAAIETITDPSVPIDAVLLDIDMPMATGFDVLRVINVVRPAVKTIVVTGSLPPEGLKQLDQLGHRCVVLKPYELAALGRKLREVLDQPV